MEGNKLKSYLLAEHVSRLKYEQLPDVIKDAVRMSVLDYLAAAVAGWRINSGFNQATYEIVAEMGGIGDSSVLFCNDKKSPMNAAFLNAVYGHGADMDDGHRKAQGHVGVTVIPPVIALAQNRHASYEDIAAAIVAGYDVYVRISEAVMPSHFIRGFHGTGTIGAIAAAAASARVLRLDAEKTHQAMSIAAVQASGLIEVAESGQEIKPINPGNAARTGVFSALLAEKGVQGPKDPLGGRNGFFRAFSDEADADKIVKDLGQKYSILTCYFKMYPACRHIHGAVDCGTKLHEMYGLTDERLIKVVRVFIYPAALKVVGAIRKPRDMSEAKFSLSYALAVSLLQGGYTLSDLWRAGKCPERIEKLIDKIIVAADAALENRAANIRGCRVEVEWMDGSIAREEVLLPKGDPENPLTKEDLRAKLRVCADGFYSQEKMNTIFEDALSMSTADDVNRLFAVMEK